MVLSFSIDKLIQEVPLPDPKDESFRKFSFRNFHPEEYEPFDPPSPVCHYPDGVEIQTFIELTSERQRRILSVLNESILSQNPDFFQIRGLRDFEKGICIFLPPSIDSETPVSLTRILPSSPGVVSPFVYIHAGKFSRFLVVDRIVSSFSDENSFQWLNPYVVIDTEEGAHFEYLAIDKLGSSVFFFKNLFSIQGRDSFFRNFHVYSGGYRCKVKQKTVLSGECSRVRCIGLSGTKSKEFWDHETEILHQKDYTESSLIHKVVLNDGSHHIFTGNLHIPAGLHRVNASQINHNLLLNPKARAESIPKLEIFSEDVRSSHGSTVGEVSPDQLFYLKSRGLSEKEARYLLIEGFVSELIDEISEESVNEEVRSLMKEVLWRL